jgi:dTDP-4-amino-4,6-dideoxygalactose transaminase
VVEDAAQALLSTYRGKYLGTFGSLGCLSFHETKNIISGEGGALLVNDERLVERAEIIREKGTNRNRFFRGEVDKYTWVDIGSSFLPSELVGAFLYAQLEQAEKINDARSRIFERYHRLLFPLQERGVLRLPHIEMECSCNGHLFYLIANSPDDRDRLLRHLSESRINAVFHYVPLHSSPAGKKYGRVWGGMAVTESISDRLIRLPMYYEMEDADVDRVVEAIFAFYEGRC